MRKCLSQHTCNICYEFENSNSTLSDPSQLFSFYKAYECSGAGYFGKFNMPAKGFLNFIEDIYFFV